MDWIQPARGKHLVAAYCKQGNELPGFIKGADFFDQLSEYQNLQGITSLCRAAATERCAANLTL